MEIFVEASPYIETKGSDKAKSELYNIPFEFNKIANALGEKPIKLFGFWESDNAFMDRLDAWQAAEKVVLFDGWTCKNMFHYQELRSKNTTITIEAMDYEVNHYGKKYLFPVLPDTIDDFINDLKRIGVILFWKPENADIYGIDNITSNKKIIDYYGLLKDLNGASS